MGILNRGLAMLRMTELARTVRSVEALKRAVRDLGLGYRNEVLHRDASNAFYRILGEERQSRLDLSGPLSHRDYLRGDWYRSESYKFFGEATWYDPATGLQEVGLFTMYSNADISSDELAALWSAQRGEYEAQTGLTLMSIDWKEKWHKIGAGYRETLEL